ncbi:MAG TPA: Hsp20/alpha crystallin family protein [Candidatus Methylacidiphilales bacterium]|nr:Hsp20/alpha crystallin family protein [Candidatus Methylacidiphilales bacterium]
MRFFFNIGFRRKHLALVLLAAAPPGPVKVSAVEARYENGVLTLRLPKDETATEPTEVPVQ